MNIETWFPTPIFYLDVLEDAKKSIECEYFAAEKEILDSVQGVTWGDNVSTTFNTHKNLIEEFNLNTLNNLINFASKNFCKYIKADSETLKVVSSWVNYYNKYQYQNKHDHLPNFLSGVYYVKTTGLDGNLIIHPPTQVMAIRQEAIEYAPKEGRIMLFPSWVEHSVRANMTDSTRISISFNLNIV